MRLKISFSKNTSDVKVNNQSLINSWIHKCLGVNNVYHNVKSDYNISHLYGGKLNADKQTLSFENGGFLIISSKNNEFINKMLVGIINNAELINGMKFSGVDYINENFLDGWNHFSTLSPFIIKNYTSKKIYKFLTLKDPGFEQQVKSYLINKLSKIDPTLELSNFDVKIPEHPNHKIKKIMIKNVINTANQCQISIFTNKKVAELLYNIGVGQSTGSGFGCIYKTENHSIYKLGLKK